MFIVVQPVLLQEVAELVLKRNSGMMLLLLADIGPDGIQVGKTYGEGPISRLP